MPCMSNPPGLGRTICRAFVPEVGFSDRMDTMRATLETKFPFSIAHSLQLPTGDEVGTSLLGIPETIGILQLDLSFIHTFAGVVRPAIIVILGVWLTWWLIDRFTPQAVI